MDTIALAARSAAAAAAAAAAAVYKRVLQIVYV
jgi:hypothetical protein